MTSAQLEFRPNSSSALPILAIGVIAVAAGFFHASSGAVALGSVLIAAPLAVRLALWYAVKRLVVRRQAPETAYEGDSIEVLIQIENRSFLPLFFPRVSEVFAPELHAQKDVLFAERVAPGEVAERAYTGDCLLPRGVYGIGPTAVAVSDPFGWFQARRDLEAPRPLKVYPRVHDIGIDERLGERISHVLDDLTRPAIGESNEFFSVREYRVGDALRKVHWGLTAHRGVPVVREHARTSTGDLTVFLDTYRLALTGVGRSSSLEYAVKIAASFAAKALARGHRVELIAGDDETTRVPAGSGSAHFQRILDLLVEVRPTGDASLVEVVERRARDVRPGTTAVVMVSRYLFHDERFLSLLRGWRRQSARVVVVLFDARTFRRVWGHSEDEQLFLDSEEALRRFRAHGIDGFLVSCGAELTSVFAARAR